MFFVGQRKELRASIKVVPSIDNFFQLNLWLFWLLLTLYAKRCLCNEHEKEPPLDPDEVELDHLFGLWDYDDFARVAFGEEVFCEEPIELVDPFEFI
jgi:hypothetical protein